MAPGRPAKKKRVLTIYTRGKTLILEFPNSAYWVQGVEASAILTRMAKFMEEDFPK